jgi:hypothetical protein
MMKEIGLLMFEDFVDELILDWHSDGISVTQS